MKRRIKPNESHALEVTVSSKPSTSYFIQAVTTVNCLDLHFFFLMSRLYKVFRIYTSAWTTTLDFSEECDTESTNLKESLKIR